MSGDKENIRLFNEAKKAGFGKTKEGHEKIVKLRNRLHPRRDEIQFHGGKEEHSPKPITPSLFDDDESFDEDIDL